MKVSSILVSVAVSSYLSACTGRDPQPIKVERPHRTSPVGSDSRPADPNIGQPTTYGSGVVNADIQVTREYLANKLRDLDLNNLSYKFTYLSKSQSDRISFDAQGKANLSLRDLPANQTGSVSLEILEGAVVKLRGTADNVTLRSNEPNKLSLDLVAVDGSTGQSPNGGGNSTDLTLEVSLGTGNGGTTTPPSGGGTTTPPSGGGTTTPPNGGGTTTPPNGGGTTTPPADPVANWDGKSNVGNSRWKIVPIDG